MGLVNPWEKLTQPIVLETNADGNWVEVSETQKETTTKKSAEKTTLAEEN